MEQLTSKINILVMPTDICNMDCIYCFHNSHHERNGKMNLHTLERLYQITLNTYSAVTFIWHGGEPLIMGLDFYKEAIHMQERYLNTDVRNRMQSNLTLLTDEMADFFVEKRIGIGSSFDGLQNEELRGNSETILRNRERLIKKGGTCGFIMVISRKNIDYLIENYDFMKEKHINYTLNFYVSTQTPNDDILILEPEYVIKKIIEFYEYWLHDYECNIHIEYFERFLKFILYNKKGVCKYNSCLGKWVGVRYDGEIVPCNRFFPKKYSYGNVWDYTNLNSAFESDGFILLLSQAIERRKKCLDCPVYSLCEGGCNNVAYNENGISNNGGASCVVLQGVFRHIVKSITDLQHTNICLKRYNPVVLELLNLKNKAIDIRIEK